MTRSASHSDTRPPTSTGLPRFELQTRRCVGTTRILRRWTLRALCLLALLVSGCLRQPNGLERIREAGVLRVAMDPSFPPFEYVDAEGKAVGFDIDLGQELARRMGVEVHFVTTTYDGLYDALVVGRADIILSALYPDPTRTEDFTFTPSYFNAGEVLIVPPDSPIEGPSDLAGRKVAVVFGTAGHMEALRWEQLLPSPPLLETRESTEEALEALATEAVEAIVIDNLAAQAAKAQGRTIRILAPPITDESYVIAVRSTESELFDELTLHLQEMQADGTLEELMERWIY